MKRPSGFDRAPERPEAVPPAVEPQLPLSGGLESAGSGAGSPSTPHDPDATADGAAASEPALQRAAPRRSVLDRLRSGLPGERSGSAAARAEAAPAATAPPATAAPEAAEAATVDLSAVRASRAGDGVDPATPRGDEDLLATEAYDDLDIEANEPAPGSGSPDGASAGELVDSTGGAAAGGSGSGSGSVLAQWRAGREADPVRAAERRVRAAERQRKAQLRRERQRFTVAARRRRRIWLVVLSAVGGLALFVAAGVFTPLMAVREIQLVGATTVPEDEVRAALARFDGVPLALVDDADVHRALEPFPLIQRYAVERIPPHTLTIRIEERVPVVSLPEGDGVALYDAAGVLLGTAEQAPAGVPLGSGALTDRASQAYRSATRALRDMPAELRAQITAVTASSGQDVTFTLASGIEVMWGDAEQSRRKAAVLSTMLASLGDREVTHIDVSSTEAPVFR